MNAELTNGVVDFGEKRQRNSLEKTIWALFLKKKNEHPQQIQFLPNLSLMPNFNI